MCFSYISFEKTVELLYKKESHLQKKIENRLSILVTFILLHKLTLIFQFYLIFFEEI